MEHGDTPERVKSDLEKEVRMARESFGNSIHTIVGLCCRALKMYGRWSAAAELGDPEETMRTCSEHARIAAAIHSIADAESKYLFDLADHIRDYITLPEDNNDE